MRKLIASAFIIAAAGAVSAADAPLWLRDIAISPDGKRIAFTYRGDIFTVPVTGGRATRVTATPAYESDPVWSPDSRTIAFAGDREGSMDVYIVDADGGAPRRLTFNSANETPEAFTPDGKSVVYAAAIQSPKESRVFPTSRMSQVWKVATDGKSRPERVLSTPANGIGWLPGGFLYEDQKGFEDKWRKHHTSSVTRDIWQYDEATGRHTNLTNRPGEDRNPVVAPDGKTVYFLSERDGGSFNVYSFPLSDPSRVTRLTSFDTHPVRFLSGSSDGTLAFGYDGEIYTMNAKGGTPAKVKVEINTDFSEPPYLHREFSRGAREAVPSPDGKQVTFSSRGDIFVTSADYATTKRITTTPQHESGPSWGADSRTLYYTSDRDGHMNIYRAQIARKEDPNFPNAVSVIETAVFAPTDTIDRQRPHISPDGKKMAYIQDRRKIAVMDLDTRSVTMLTNGETCTSNDGGDIFMDWSPDSEWLAVTIDTHQRDPYYDIAIYPADGGKPVRLTNDAYTNVNPRWTPDGNAVMFQSDRYGMKNLASWGSQDDILMVFVNRAAYDRYFMSAEDRALAKEAEKKAKEAEKKKSDDKKDSKKGSKSKDKKADAETAVAEDAVIVEPEGIEDRVVRLTPFSSQISDMYVDKDGETLYFLSKGEDGYDLWKKDLVKGDISLDKKLGAYGMALLPTADQKTLFLLSPSQMKKMTLAGGKTENITYSGYQKIDLAAEREYMYDYMVEEVAKRFLVKDMFGVDWDGYAKAYRRFLPHITNNYDFAEMASELLGELNVSHTGGRYYPDGATEPTASLGLIYDFDAKAPGLTVAEVLFHSPFARKSSKMVPGAVITSIGDTDITTLPDPLEALNTMRRAKTLVTFTLPSGEEVSEVVKPMTMSAENADLYKRWTDRNAALVDSLSGGRLGYVHLQSMSDDSYRRIYADVLGRYADREGIVIDTRWNGGGRLHEDIEVLFSGKKYLTQEIRGVKSGEMPSKRWLRPSVMVTCEANYSNAHGTPWMYKHCGLGKLVGAPVPGTMSSVNWIDMQDDSMVFGVPVVGFRTAEGNFLENTQLEPDILVINDPATIVKGEDKQLKAAVSSLLNDIDKK